MSNINDLAKSEAFVYCWTDHLTNKLYVGSHKGSVEDGYICSSKYMMEEYNKRPTDFTRQIIAEGALEDIRTLETKILQNSGARNSPDFYNLHANDGFYFVGEITESHRRNMSIAASKRVRSKDHMEKLHAGRRNSKNSPEHNDAISKFSKGRKMSDQAKHNMSIAKLGKKLTDEHKAKLGKGDHSYMQTEEYKAKMRASWIKRKGELINAG